METPTREALEVGKSMDTECIVTPTETPMRENGLTMNSMAMAFIHSPTVQGTKETSKTPFSMEKADSSIKIMAKNN